MSAERDLHDILDTRLRDVPQLRPTLLGDVFDQTRTIPQRRHRWPHPDRGFTMFSALKFVAAAVIVALFGGFLLAGVLTTAQGDETVPAAVTASPEPETTRQPTESSSPSVRTDILPGVELTVELVEPGVYQVVDDGVRDLASKNDTDIVAGEDGGIWLLRHQRFFRLGSDTAHAWATKKPAVSDFEVAPGGTVWTIQTRRGEEG